MRSFRELLGAGLAGMVLFASAALGFYAGWPWGLALVFGVLTFLMAFALLLWPNAYAEDLRWGRALLFVFLLLTVLFVYMGYTNFGWPKVRF